MPHSERMELKLPLKVMLHPQVSTTLSGLIPAEDLEGAYEY
jgi:hypothetical protein